MEKANHPKVSVLIISYNLEAFIGQTLRSVLTQETNFDYEIVIGDDCSCDNTRGVINEFILQYPGKIRPVFHSQNLGAVNNFVTTYANCVGEYIATLDGDDPMLPGKLQRQVDFLDAHPDYVMCAHAVKWVCETGKDYKNKVWRWHKDTAVLDDFVRYGSIFSHSAKLLRRSLFREPFDTKNARVADYLWHIQLTSCGKVGYIDEILGLYVVRGQGFTKQNRSIGYFKQAFAEQFYAIERAEQLGASIEACRFGRARVHYSYAMSCLGQGDYVGFKEHIIASKQYAYLSWKRKLNFYLRYQPKGLHYLRSFLIKKTNA